MDLWAWRTTSRGSVRSVYSLSLIQAFIQQFDINMHRSVLVKKEVEETIMNVSLKGYQDKDAQSAYARQASVGKKGQKTISPSGNRTPATCDHALSV